MDAKEDAKSLHVPVTAPCPKSGELVLWRGVAAHDSWSGMPQLPSQRPAQGRETIGGGPWATSNLRSHR